MSLIQLQDLELHFGPRVIFNAASFTLFPNERVGLIGPNGAGKSTLFRMIMGTQQPDSGTVIRAAGLKVGLLSQDPVFETDETVMDEAERGFATLHTLAHQLRDIEHAMHDAQGDALEKILLKYEKVQHDFEAEGGYAWSHRLEGLLLGVGLPKHLWDQPLHTLSGGQKSKLMLVKLLAAEPDVLLLDEPTNHLDLAAIEWLEGFLLSWRGSCIIISHDRYFLDRLVTRIVWLTQSAFKSYPGTYSAFEQQRQLAELSQSRAYEQQQADIEKQAEYIRRFKAGQRARQAKGRERRLDRLMDSDALIQNVATQSTIHFKMANAPATGKQVLVVKGLSKAFESQKLWSDVEFDVERGDRIGLIGPNGCGKTTLLRCLLGQADADAGTVKWGSNLKIAYYDQSFDTLDEEQSVFEAATENLDPAIQPRPSEQTIRDLLGAMLFRGHDIEKPVSILSGGERARLRIVQILLEKPNVLILDEPTNHLDIDSCRALESALASFEGVILTVSHDRYFLKQITTRMLVAQPPEVIVFNEGFEAWQEKVRLQAQQESDAKADAASQKRADAKADAKAAKKAAQASPAPAATAPKFASNKQSNTNQPSTKKDNPYLRKYGKHTVEQLEKLIEETETEIGSVQLSLAHPSAAKDPGKTRSLTAQLNTLSNTLDELEAEYLKRSEG